MVQEPASPAVPPPAHLPIHYYYIAGGLGDTCACLVSHPLDTIKVRQQLAGELDPGSRGSPQGLRALARTSRSVVAAEGIGGLYRGLTASILRQSTFATMRHGWYASLAAAAAAASHASSSSHASSPASAPTKDSTKLPPHPSSTLSAWQTVAFGVLAGGVAAFVANPSDVALIRMQADGHWPVEKRRNYRNAPQAIYSIMATEGSARLWRGCGPTVLRAALVTATQLPTYHGTKALLLRVAPGMWGRGQDDPKLHLTSSLASAACASFATCPVDVIKTRIMNMQKAGGADAYYTSAVDCAVRTVKAEGIAGLFKGLVPTFARLAPHTIVLWQVQELVLRSLWQRDTHNLKHSCISRSSADLHSGCGAASKGVCSEQYLNHP